MSDAPGLITAPIGNAALAAPGENAPTSAYPSSVWDYTPFLEDSSRLVRAIGNDQATFGAIDEYGRQITAPEPTIPAAEANQKYGIPGQLTFGNDVPESVAADKYQAKRDELMRQDAASRSDAGLFTRLGAGFAAGIADPLNLAAAFVPGVGEARIEGLLARAGIEGVAGSTLGRLGAGAINAELGQVPLTALRFGLAKDEGEDYTMANAAADVLMGGAIGAGGHLFAGLAKDVIGSAFGRSAVARLVADDPVANEQTARAAIAQQLQDEPVNLAPVLDSTALRSAYADRLSARGTATEGTYNAFTPEGMRVELRPEVAEASDLVPSNLESGEVNPAYPAELQPRDRTNAASLAQVQEMASRLEPERLGPSPEASTGAPIVNDQNVVESGNGRTMALMRAYRDPAFADQATAYRAFLEAQGHDVSGMREPILIGRRVTQLSSEETARFTKAANERATLGMSAAEQARADVGRAAKAIDSYEPGPLNGAGNRDFIARFMAQIPSEERGGMILGDGHLSVAGETRIRAALFAHAYGDALGPTLERMLNGNVDGMKGPANALADVAGKWSQLRAAAAGGEIPAGLDITPAIGEAMQLLDRAQKTGTPIADLLAQSDMIGGPSPAAAGLLRLMFRDEGMRQPVARAKIADLLSRYVDQAMEAKPGPGLFGEAETTPADILRAILSGDDRGETAARGLETAAEEQQPHPTGHDIDVSDRKPSDPISTVDIAEMAKSGDLYPLSIRDDNGKPIDPLNSVILAQVKDAALQIHSVKLNEDYQGRGLAIAAYEQLVNWSHDRGLRFLSDSEVSPDAQRLYQALERRGYKVERTEGINDGEGETLRAADKSSSVFEVGPKADKNSEVAINNSKAPPELTKQIDTLESEFRDLDAAGALDPDIADELQRISDADAETQGVAGAIGQAALCLLGGL